MEKSSSSSSSSKQEPSLVWCFSCLPEPFIWQVLSASTHTKQAIDILNLELEPTITQVPGCESTRVLFLACKSVFATWVAWFAIECVNTITKKHLYKKVGKNRRPSSLYFAPWRGREPTPWLIDAIVTRSCSAPHAARCSQTTSLAAEANVTTLSSIYISGAYREPRYSGTQEARHKLFGACSILREGYFISRHMHKYGMPVLVAVTPLESVRPPEKGSALPRVAEAPGRMNRPRCAREGKRVNEPAGVDCSTGEPHPIAIHVLPPD